MLFSRSKTFVQSDLMCTISFITRTLWKPIGINQNVCPRWRWPLWTHILDWTSNTHSFPNSENQVHVCMRHLTGNSLGIKHGKCWHMKAWNTLCIMYTSVSVEKRTVLFWTIMQQVVVIPYLHFRTTYRCHLQGSAAWRWDQLVVPECRYRTTITPCIKPRRAQFSSTSRRKSVIMQVSVWYWVVLSCHTAPYNHDCPSLESSIVSYWVMPPPETKPHEYGKPMLMSYSVVQDRFLSQDALNEMVGTLMSVSICSFWYTVLKWANRILCVLLNHCNLFLMYLFGVSPFMS